jgi:hypothetical protein
MQPEALLAQFDSEVATRCDLIRANAAAVSENLRSALELTLLGIPECVRGMPLRVLMEAFDGDIQRAAAHCAPAFATQAGSGPATQTAKGAKGRREPVSPPPRGAPRARAPTKQGAANENAAARVCESPGDRGLGTQTRIPARQAGRSPKRN